MTLLFQAKVYGGEETLTAKSLIRTKAGVYLSREGSKVNVCQTGAFADRAGDILSIASRDGDAIFVQVDPETLEVVHE